MKPPPVTAIASLLALCGLCVVVTGLYDPSSPVQAATTEDQRLPGIWMARDADQVAFMDVIVTAPIAESISRSEVILVNPLMRGDRVYFPCPCEKAMHGDEVHFYHREQLAPYAGLVYRTKPGALSFIWDEAKGADVGEAHWWDPDVRQLYIYGTMPGFHGRLVHVDATNTYPKAPADHAGSRYFPRVALELINPEILLTRPELAR